MPPPPGSWPEPHMSSDPSSSETTTFLTFALLSGTRVSAPGRGLLQTEPSVNFLGSPAGARHAADSRAAQQTPHSWLRLQGGRGGCKGACCHLGQVASCSGYVPICLVALLSVRLPQSLATPPPPMVLTFFQGIQSVPLSLFLKMSKGRRGVGGAYFSLIFISSFHKYLLSTYCVPGTVHAAMDKPDHPRSYWS